MTPQLLDDYLAQSRSEHRAALRLLYDTIAAAVPDTELVIRRGVPAFRYRGRPLVSFGDAEKHVSLYIMQGNTIAAHQQELSRLDTSRTVVRFTPERIPTALVRKLVRARAAEIDGKLDVPLG